MSAGGPGPSDLLRIADALADAAAAETLPRFRRGIAVESKDAGGFDPVTEADRAAEAAMRAVLADLRPEDGVLGEEAAATPSRSGRTWVLDPVDGTRAFVAGAPTWGTLIACGPDGGAPEIGLIDQPHIGERFAGGPGGATLNGAPIRCRGIGGLADAILFTTFPGVGAPDERAGFEAVSDRVRLTRHGLDCYAYALVALGTADLVIEAGLAPYDVQGPMAVVRAAGGLVTDWRGGPAHAGGRVVAAGCAAVHAAALDILRRVP